MAVDTPNDTNDRDVVEGRSNQHRQTGIKPRHFHLAVRTRAGDTIACVASVACAGERSVGVVGTRGKCGAVVSASRAFVVIRARGAAARPAAVAHARVAARRVDTRRAHIARCSTGIRNIRRRVSSFTWGSRCSAAWIAPKLWTVNIVTIAKAITEVVCSQ